MPRPARRSQQPEACDLSQRKLSQSCWFQLLEIGFPESGIKIIICNLPNDAEKTSLIRLSPAGVA
jgi:hypothetical protein